MGACGGAPRAGGLQGQWAVGREVGGHAGSGRGARQDGVPPVPHAHVRPLYLIIVIIVIITCCMFFYVFMQLI